MKFKIHQESRQGARHSNQDQVRFLYNTKSLLLIACDGMGGHKNGEIASSYVAQFISGSFKAHAKPKVKDPETFLRSSIERANYALLKHAKEKQYADVPRTTCVVALIQDGRITTANVGDSRIYHFREREVFWKSLDHSVVQQLIDSGKITEQQAERHEDRNKIFNCIGQQHTPRVDVSQPTLLKSQDRILLTTDGLWGPVSTEKLIEALYAFDCKVALPWLLDLAEINAGRECDNLSAIAMEWMDSTDIENSEDAQDTEDVRPEDMDITDLAIQATIASIKNISEPRANR